MINKNASLAAALSLILPAISHAGAEPSAVNFDAGVDVSAVLKEAKTAAAKSHGAGKGVRNANFRRYDRDCVSFTFDPDDAPKSDAVYLRSTEWIEECTYGDPRHGGRQCWERPGYTYHERAQVTLQDRRPLLPWEFDRFTVCLEGPWLDVYERETAYDYKLVRGGSRDGDIVMAPVKKIPMRPDPVGITPASLTPALALTLADKWSSYYAGETTAVKLKLKKDVPNWFDPVLLEKELSFPAAASYGVDFKAFVKDFSQKLEAGKQYYVEYSFKRVGTISKPDWTKASESQRATYQPSALPVGR